MNFELTEYGVLCDTKPDFRNAGEMWDAAELLWDGAHPPEVVEGAPVLSKRTKRLKAYGDIGKMAGAKMAFCLEENRGPWLASLE